MAENKNLYRTNQEESRTKLTTIERKAASDSRRTSGDPGTHYPDLNPARIPCIHGMISIRSPISNNPPLYRCCNLLYDNR
jgi:hypothetical protein